MKIIKKICFGIFVVIVLLYLFIIVSPRLFAGFYPFGIKTAVVLTGSMSPAIEINDFVIVKKPEEIKVGDIVSYSQEDSNMEVLHRVVEIEGETITTKGDANNANDKPIEKSQVTGVYVGKAKYFGKILSFVTQPVAFSIIVVILLVVLFAPYKKFKKTKGEGK